MIELLEFAKGKLNEEDLAKFELLAKDIESKNNVSNVNDISSAIDFINSNEMLKKGFDSAISKIVDSHDAKFKVDKLPIMRKELEAEIRKELNPEETVDSIKIRELEQKINAAEAKELRATKQEQLRAKAKEIGFDTEKASRYVNYGDDAEKFLIEDADFIKNSINSELDKRLKENNITTTPPSGEEESDVDFITKMDNIGFL